MYLTRFLLARLSEDEAAALAGNAPESGLFALYRTPDRVLSEVAARRRVVEISQERPDDEAWADVLRAMALPYTTHPDYRPE